MKLKIVWLIISCVSLVGYAGDETRTEEIKGQVTKVIDGNTIEISATDNEVYKVLIHGIDSPDPGQNYSEEAKKFLEKMLLKKSVTITIHGKDRLGNRLGSIKVEGAPDDPRSELVKAGLAWTTEPIAELEELKERARVQGRGLWIDQNPTPPWIYRRQQSMQQLKSS